MQFRLAYTETNLSGQLKYIAGEHSFNFEPQTTNAVTSLLVNEVQIEVDKDGRALYVWGFCPTGNWLETKDMPEEPAKGSLTVLADEPLLPGVSCKVNNNRWQVYVNRTAGWVRIGDDRRTAAKSSVEFAPGCIAVLDSTNNLISLWLHPLRLP